MTQLSFDGVPRARLSDPETSHKAAQSVSDVPRAQRAVLFILDFLGASGTDEAIAGVYEQFPGLPKQSPSGLRTRRKELVDLGLVVDSGRRLPLDTGRLGIVWTLAT